MARIAMAGAMSFMVDSPFRWLTRRDSAPELGEGCIPAAGISPSRRGGGHSAGGRRFCPWAGRVSTELAGNLKISELSSFTVS
jgi:hypothetical protein